MINETWYKVMFLFVSILCVSASIHYAFYLFDDGIINLIWVVFSGLGAIGILLIIGQEMIMDRLK